MCVTVLLGHSSLDIEFWRCSRSRLWVCMLHVTCLRFSHRLCLHNTFIRLFHRHTHTHSPKIRSQRPWTLLRRCDIRFAIRRAHSQHILCVFLHFGELPLCSLQIHTHTTIFVYTHKDTHISPISCTPKIWWGSTKATLPRCLRLGDSDDSLRVWWRSCFLFLPAIWLYIPTSSQTHTPWDPQPTHTLIYCVKIESIPHTLTKLHINCVWGAILVRSTCIGASIFEFDSGSQPVRLSWAKLKGIFCAWIAHRTQDCQKTTLSFRCDRRLSRFSLADRSKSDALSCRVLLSVGYFWRKNKQIIKKNCVIIYETLVNRFGNFKPHFKWLFLILSYWEC